MFTNNKVIKKVRFMTCFKTEYISREDFVSDEAWNQFLRFRRFDKCKMAASRNKNSRKEKKIENLNGLIKDLEKKAEFNAAEYLKVF